MYVCNNVCMCFEFRLPRLAKVMSYSVMSSFLGELFVKLTVIRSKSYYFTVGAIDCKLV